ncbi:hypothetical protein C6Q35_02835 [Burkholderia multivorans]|nr:hypothetical protein C6Q35_02835 [Burkholderia multivorans]
MNALRAALAPIPAEPWDALTAERRIADHAPTPAGANRRAMRAGPCTHRARRCRDISRRRTRTRARRTGARPKAPQPPLLPPTAPATGRAIRARK